MNNRKLYIFLGALLGMVALLSWRTTHKNALRLAVPKGWPKPAFKAGKLGLTEDGFLLGRMLFNDPILSKDNSVSCASCHLVFTAFTHADHSVSHGIYGLKGTRNSLALFNLAWSPAFMWDGGVTDLVQQPIKPITSHVEMDSRLDDVVRRLNDSPEYRKLFLPHSGTAISQPNICSVPWPNSR